MANQGPKSSYRPGKAPSAWPCQTQHTVPSQGKSDGRIVQKIAGEKLPFRSPKEDLPRPRTGKGNNRCEYFPFQCLRCIAEARSLFGRVWWPCVTCQEMHEAVEACSRHAT